MKRFAIVLSGCGVFDGSEIHEAVMTMLAVDNLGAKYSVFAPDILQHHTVNHLTGEAGPGRHVLQESARIARGKIAPLSQLKAADFDALIFPGGFGAAKNLCTYAFEGAAMKVDPDVERVIVEFRAAKKPIGALCIAPVILAKVVKGCLVTLGKGGDDAKNVEAMGARHQPTSHEEVCVDETHLVFSGPCYMLDSSIGQIQRGAENVVCAMLKAMNS
jgi:enhancing lycopene biosynthesis protein 2